MTTGPTHLSSGEARVTLVISFAIVALHTSRHVDALLVGDAAWRVSRVAGLFHATTRCHVMTNLTKKNPCLHQKKFMWTEDIG
jgi:hypothetical protein